MLRTTRKQLGLVGALVALAIAASSAIAIAADPASSAIDAAARFDFPPKPHSGFSLAIVHGDRVTYENAFGYRDDGTPDRFIPIDHDYYGTNVKRASAARALADPRTIYAIGSVTKQFTAAALLLLVERHQVGLDDAVHRYAPEFISPALTIRMLLNQRSGLPDFNSLEFVKRVRPHAKRADGSIDELLVSREIARLPVHFPPGAQFEYSNSNYFVLGTIVERIAHQPLGTFLSSNVFGPLGMSRTAYAGTAASDDVAVGYRLDDKNVVRRAYPWDLAWLGGAGAMTSTVTDLARWNVALLGHRVLTAASLAQMWHGIDAGRGQGAYAMGWIEDSLGTHRYLWHNGEVGGFHALNVIFPSDDLAFTLLANNQDAKLEYLLPKLGALYFPVRGLDAILPHSAVVLIEASLAVALGALAIGIVAIVTFRRFVIIGVVAALLAFVLGFFMPTIVGFLWGGLIALVPVGIYLLALRLPTRTPPAKRV